MTPTNLSDHIRDFVSALLAGKHDEALRPILHRGGDEIETVSVGITLDVDDENEVTSHTRLVLCFLPVPEDDGASSYGTIHATWRWLEREQWSECTGADGHGSPCFATMGNEEEVPESRRLEMSIFDGTAPARPPRTTYHIRARSSLSEAEREQCIPVNHDEDTGCPQHYLTPIHVLGPKHAPLRSNPVAELPF